MLSVESNSQDEAKIAPETIFFGSEVKQIGGNFRPKINREIEEKKLFWIKEVSLLKKAKSAALKRLINHTTRF